MELMSVSRLHHPDKPFSMDSVPKPEPTGNDVLVRVRACGMVPNLGNVIQYGDIAPEFPLPEFPAILGLDPAGEIAAVGPDVLELTPGQRVYVNPARSCGSCSWCRKDLPMECDSYTFAGYFGFGPGSRRVFHRYPSGGFAEYLVAPSASIVVLPDEVTFEQAGRFGYLGTAYAALRRAQAGSDTSVLINGATGTLGVGAVMVALAMGVPKILAVARNENLLGQLKDLAPRRIITHSNDTGPCTEWARAQTAGRGPDVMLEARSPGTSTESTTSAMASVARGGRIVTVGGDPTHFEIDPIWFMLNQITYVGSLWFTTAQAEEMAAMVAAGTLDLTPFRHQRFPLDQVTQALAACSNREHGGFVNVVVNPC